MKSFIYDVPTKIFFGDGLVKDNLSREISCFGKRVLLVYGKASIKKSTAYDDIVEELKREGISFFELSDIDPNPRIESVNRGAEICKKENIDVILAAGGGSVIDAAKFIAAAKFYDGDAWDLILYPDRVKKCLPIITVLTLSATGSEMNPNSVISNPENRDKKAGTHICMYPRVSFLNPIYTYNVNTYQTACGSVDIMSHILETYFYRSGNMFMLDRVMESLLKTVIEFTPIAMQNPKNYEARANLMWASSWAINGFIEGEKIKTWTCHPMEHQLSGYYDITHGLGLAILTPRFLQYCLNEKNVEIYYQLGINVFDIDKGLDKMKVARLAIESLSNYFFNVLGLTSNLKELGIDDKHFEEMAEKACGKIGMISGFADLSKDDVIKIYKMCL